MIFFSHHSYLLLSFLVVMGFLSGFIDAIAGGGGLISLPALTLTGMPMAFVLGTSKLQAAIGTAIAVYKYHANGLISFATVYRGLISGFIGAVVGAILVNHISNHFMFTVVPFLMLAVLIFNLCYPKIGIHPGKKLLSEIPFFTIFGLIFGFYDSFFGPGTGNFWLISIVFFLGYNFLEASGYAKVLNLKSNLFALAVFLFYHKVNLFFGLIMSLGQIAGNYCGARMVVLRGSKIVRPLFLTIVFFNVIIMFFNLIYASNNHQIIM